MTDPSNSAIGHPTAESSWMPLRFVPGKASVIVPTYNRRDLLPEALDSVANQTYRPIEIIIVDDGSTDGTSEAVSAWARLHSDPGIELRYYYKANGNVADARNYGLQRSTGEYVQFLDSDDLLLSHKLDSHVLALNASPSLGYVYGRTVMKRGCEVLGYVGSPIPANAEASVIARYNWHTSGPLYRRSTCLGVGPWSTVLPPSEDLMYEARVKVLGFKGAFTQAVGSVWRHHGGSRLTDIDHMSAQRAELLCAHLIDLLTAMRVTHPMPWNDTARYLVRAALLYGITGDRSGMTRCFDTAGTISRRPFTIVVSLSHLISQALHPRIALRMGELFAKLASRCRDVAGSILRNAVPHRFARQPPLV